MQVIAVRPFIKGASEEEIRAETIHQQWKDCPSESIDNKSYL